MSSFVSNHTRIGPQFLDSILNQIHSTKEVGKFAQISKKYNQIVCTKNKLQRLDDPSPLIFGGASVFNGQFKNLVKYINDYRMSIATILEVSEEEDFSLIKKYPTCRMLLKHCIDLTIRCLEEMDLSYFNGLSIKKLSVDYSLLSFNQELKYPLNNLIPFFSKSLEQITLDNVMLDDKYLPSILALLKDNNPKAEVKIVVVQKSNYLYDIEKINKVNDNVVIVLKYDILNPFSEQICEKIVTEELYLHPSIFQKYLVTPANKYVAASVAQLIDKCAIQYLCLERAVPASEVPDVEIDKLKITGRIPRQFYQTQQLKTIRSLEVTEKTIQQKTEEHYDLTQFTHLTELKVGDDLEFKSKKRIINLPNTIKVLYWRQNFAHIGKDVSVNGQLGIKGLNKLEFVSFEPIETNFENVVFPQSLKDLRFNRAPFLTDMQQIGTLNNCTQLILADCESLKNLIFPKNLQILKISYCTQVTSLNLVSLTNLTNLELGQFAGTTMQLPLSLKEFTLMQSQKLIHLDLTSTLIENFSIDRCEHIKQVILPTSVKQVSYKDCDLLEEIDVSQMKDCKQFGIEMLPELRVLKLSTSIVHLNIVDVESIEAIQDLRSFTSLVDAQFINCSKIKQLQLPKQLKTLSLDDNASLSQINLSELTQCKVIVSNCEQLKSY
ncbi:hypothetical protein EDI_043320 [Entamoeba dispar SAW760]|uniref:Uncharacterized protein n=1 Tax=Entamoeba dispar (strain ATCC PRA-260 / SAW760) TaxID=370354 RepID=B0ESD0_ENTDS|nr:uncharacterized protein EDI_043320 [Entamoeba dispar SAW760]EDR22554.1 hypothetical protein EDI_043320 [Entamoeba dispar SAW760]|eukprot:EDR22554.1 hypothetical protein EDI_043320 [Entamoeba dispar SAW760]